MGSVAIREQLHKQIDILPDEVVEQIADFAVFVMVRKNITPKYGDRDQSQWQDFALAQFFIEEDEVEYTLKDAQEIYRP
jgi:hypothetical protein